MNDINYFSSLCALSDSLSSRYTSDGQCEFGVGKLQASAIEVQRTRMGWEVPYQSYHFKRLTELLCLADGVWNIDKRSQLPDTCRSEYIDRLASAIAAGDMGDYNAAVMRYTLDINEYLYNNAAVAQPDMWFTHIEDIKLRKRYEQQVFADEIAAARLDAVSIDARTLTVVMKRLASHLHLEFSSLSGPQRLILSCPLAGNGRISMVVEDIPNLRKWGQLMPYYEIITVQDGKEIKAVMPYNHAVPGGRWYGWKNTCWDSIILGLLAFCDVLQCAKKIAK